MGKKIHILVCSVSLPENQRKTVQIFAHIAAINELKNKSFTSDTVKTRVLSGSEFYNKRLVAMSVLVKAVFLL